ncbi:MAG TPA: hypothetical protein VLA66_00170, partial [Thermoanaerobaculia bacterium]|nr:hypothetical protein [Thermoanaerobaculia bacterium]
MRRAAGLALLAAAVACARPEPPLPATSVALIDLFPRAGRWAETSRIDFGAPGARERLWSGWGPDEQGPE